MRQARWMRSAGVLIGEHERKLSVESRKAIGRIVMLMVDPNLITVFGIVGEYRIGLFGVRICRFFKPIFGENPLTVVDSLVDIKQ